ncbi:hypothetical protein NIES4074_43050 [Cylindrospermum sp. NIES-4074]|nr:hypothetical protein NIES4074_43050 [Cylindrospermum sp. NIES-4074]
MASILTTDNIRDRKIPSDDIELIKVLNPNIMVLHVFQTKVMSIVDNFYYTVNFICIMI